MNTVHVPARAATRRKRGGSCGFVMRADVQEALNKAMLQLPVNLTPPSPTTASLAQGRDLLSARRRPCPVFRPRHQRGSRQHRDEGLPGIHALSAAARRDPRDDRARARVRIYGPPPMRGCSDIARACRRRGRPRRVRHAARAGMRRAGLSTVDPARAGVPAVRACSSFIRSSRSVRLSLHDWDGVGATRSSASTTTASSSPTRCFATALANNLRWLACYLAAPLRGLALAVLLHQKPVRHAARAHALLHAVRDQPGDRRTRVRPGFSTRDSDC